MSSPRITYTFRARPWKYQGPSGWYFISLPGQISQQIRSSFRMKEEGWGRLKVTARIGDCEWKTAIWFDGKQNTYLLPLKAEVRKKEVIVPGRVLEAVISV